MDKTQRKCSICNKNNKNILYHINMCLPDCVRLPHQYDIVTCKYCGFTYADVRATQEMYNAYYRQCNMYSESTYLKSDFDQVITEQRYSLIQKYVPKEANVIDLGCGSGSLLIYLKKQGYQHLTGLDPSQKSIEVLRKNGIRGYVGNIFDEIRMDLRGKFDIVISTAVIEHIYDLNTYILQCQQYMARQGRIIVEAPAVEGFPKYIRDIPNYFNHEHINYFSLNSLDNLFLQHGFKRESSDRDSRKVVCRQSWVEEILLAVYQLDLNCHTRIQTDNVSSVAICNYLDQEKNILKQRYDQLHSYISTYSQIIVWGTGALTMQIMANIPEMSEKTVFFIDNNHLKYAMKLCGKPIYPPTQLIQKKISCPIIILSMMNAEDIVKQIKRMGVTNEYYVLQ